MLGYFYHLGIFFEFRGTVYGILRMFEPNPVREIVLQTSQYSLIAHNLLQGLTLCSTLISFTFYPALTFDGKFYCEFEFG